MMISRDWHEARDYCQKRRGDLLVAETSEEYNFIRNMIVNYPGIYANVNLSSM